jgi:hypothetical protein
MAIIQPIIFCIEFPSDLAFTISRINLQTDYSLAFFDLSRTLLNENETDEAPGIVLIMYGTSRRWILLHLQT